MEWTKNKEEDGVKNCQFINIEEIDNYIKCG